MGRLHVLLELASASRNLAQNKLILSILSCVQEVPQSEVIGNQRAEDRRPDD